MTDDAELNDTQQRFTDGDADAWASEPTTVGRDTAGRIGAAIHSVRSVDPAAMSVVAEWADRARRAAARPCQRAAGGERAVPSRCTVARPSSCSTDGGVLGERFTAVHATHLAGYDIALLQSSHSTCCICPTTERDLADGIGPTAAFRKARDPDVPSAPIRTR